MFLVYIFRLILILVYALIYALLLKYFLLLLLKFKDENNRLKNIVKDSWTYQISTSIFFILFCFYSFSSSQNSGFGDWASLPIGNDYRILNIDGSGTSLELSKGGGGQQMHIGDFIVENKVLYAKYLGPNMNDCEYCFLVFDTRNAKLNKFETTYDYEEFAKMNNLPLEKEFKNFADNYREYWKKDYKWYLP